ncbi:response regulator transcription factor [Caulobacter sp. RHG1]|uniref:response regulator transcription factor n=1 Tax=Caulobacter sp. (strain RHG1) TaxID=2545762 RepID=UPI0015546CA2|nr:response regulator transcription factor [Caulobacter sp. RHG1]NQE63740.1 response regulator in two-component regulatory system with PhoQ [Caulobacter sp. RHG1]
MNIFLLEDDADTAAFIARGLKEKGHQVEVAGDGVTAITRLLADRFDVIVLDRMVPGLDGLTVLKAVRAAGHATPVLMLTAKSQIADRVAGLEEGADDYLVKPFAFAELAARVTALGRRPLGSEAAAILKVADVEMNLLRREVRRGGKAVELQPREFTLLEQLMRNPGRVVTRTMLLDQVWNFGFDPKTNIVETHMSRLRSKLNEGFSRSAIRTVRGSGYLMEDSV